MYTLEQTDIRTVTMIIMVPYSVLFVLYSLSSSHPEQNLMKVVFLDPILNLPPHTHGGVLWGVRGGGVTGFCHNTPFKMHLSCVSF